MVHAVALALALALRGASAASWYYRPGALKSAVTPPTSWGNGTSYDSAWTGEAKHIGWRELGAGDTLFVCGVGSGLLIPPAGLASVTIDGACPTGRGGYDNASWFGGATLLFGGAQAWAPLSDGIFRTTYASREDLPANAVAILAAARGGDGAVDPRRLARANCTERAPLNPRAWPAAAFCVAAAAGGGEQAGSEQAVYYRPPPEGRATLAVQLESAVFAIQLLRTTDVALRHLAVYGPAERPLDIVGGARLEVSSCSFSWGSFSGVTLNFKSAPNGGLNGGRIVDNIFFQNANGIYYVNQANQGQDDTANSNDVSRDSG
jgi:hypothetical protein